MKISIIGAGNVGGLTAMRLCEQNIGKIILIDVAKGLATGKALDLEDSCAVLKTQSPLSTAENFANIKGSQIIVITAGLARRPGMDREELIKKNASIIESICKEIKSHAKDAIVLIVSNPVDILTYLAIKKLGFKSNRIFGLGVNLDACRFSNLISKELGVPNSEIDALVIGSHGKMMLPLERFTYIKGVSLDQLLDARKISELKQATVQRGARIVEMLGSGSAYFAPSAAIVATIKAMAKDERRVIGLSAYLDGKYGLKDVCIGVPCRVGKAGIEEIVELELNQEEKKLFFASAEALKKQLSQLNGSV